MTPLQKMIEARKRLILDYPFWGTLALKLKLVEDFTVRTGWTNGKILTFNPAWVDTLTMAQAIAFNAHEVGHPMLKHHLRRQGRKYRQWQYCCVTGDSLIMLANQNSKPIKDIQIGEIILGEKDGTLVESKVLTRLQKVDNVMEVVLCSGYKLTCSLTHQILTQRGYIEARKIKETDKVFLVRKGKKIHLQKLHNNDNHQHGQNSQTGSQTSRQLSSPQRSIQKPQNCKASQLEESFKTIRNRSGVSCWNNRWRRVNLTNKKREILSTKNSCIHNKLLFSKKIRVNEFLRSFSKKQEWKLILADLYQWISNYRFSKAFTTLFNYQKRARKVSHRIHLPTMFTTASRRKPYKENEEYRPSHPQIQYSRIKTVRRLKRKELLFDLTTTSHSYIANEIIVHNCDLALNPIIMEAGFDLPGNPLFEERFKGMSAEEIYKVRDKEEQEKLEELEKQRQEGDSNNDGKEDESDNKTNGKPAGNEDQDEEDEEDEDQDEGDEGSGDGSTEDKNEEDERGQEDKKDQEDEESQSGDGGTGSAGEDDNQINSTDCGEVRDFPGETTEQPTEAEKKVEEDEWKISTVQATQVAKKCGDIPGGIERVVNEIIHPKLDPHEIFQQFIAQCAKNDYNWIQPNRRYIQSELYLPNLKSDELLSIVFALDTSGSISEKELNTMTGWLEMVLEAYNTEINVVYSDCRIQGHEVFTRDDLPLKLKPKGYGGTNFVPVFDWVKEQEIKPTCLVYMTDLCCWTYPEKEPEYPVLWIHVKNSYIQSYGFSEPPFGEVVEIEVE